MKAMHNNIIIMQKPFDMFNNLLNKKLIKDSNDEILLDEFEHDYFKLMFFSQEKLNRVEKYLDEFISKLSEIMREDKRSEKPYFLSLSLFDLKKVL